MPTETITDGEIVTETENGIILDTVIADEHVPLAVTQALASSLAHNCQKYESTASTPGSN